MGNGLGPGRRKIQISEMRKSGKETCRQTYESANKVWRLLYCILIPIRKHPVVWEPNDQADKVTWLVAIHWHERQTDDMITVKEVEALHGSKNMTSTYEGQSSDCLLWVINLPATDTNTEPPAWHYSLRRLTGHLTANGPFSSWKRQQFFS